MRTYSFTFTSRISMAITSTSSMEYFAVHEVRVTMVRRRAGERNRRPVAHSRPRVNFTRGNARLKHAIRPARKYSPLR